MTIGRALSVALLLLLTPAVFGADQPVPPAAPDLFVTLLPPSALLVVQQMQVDEPELLVQMGPSQVVVARITPEGTKVIGCVDNQQALTEFLRVPPVQARTTSQPEVK